MNLRRILSKLSLVLVLGLLILATPGLGSDPSQAQSAPPAQAGLVIVQPDQEPLTFCVALNAAEITGVQMLEQVGVDFIADYSNSMGAAVCRIDGTGCAFPTQDCFCECQGASCTYWSYHRRDAGSTEWIYAQFGGGQNVVAPGSVEAWVWSVGDSGSSNLGPPDVTLADICAGEIAASTTAVDRLNWPTYLGFVGLLLLLGAAGILRRRRFST